MYRLRWALRLLGLHRRLHHTVFQKAGAAERLTFHSSFVLIDYAPNGIFHGQNAVLCIAELNSVK